MVKKTLSLATASILAVAILVCPMFSANAETSSLTLVAQYQFEDSNNLGLDSSGKNNNLSEVGTVKQGTGVFGGKSLELDGTNALAAAVDESGKDFVDKLEGDVVISFFAQNHDIDVPNGDGAGHRWISNGQWGAGTAGMALATKNYGGSDGYKARPMNIYTNNYSDGEGNWCASLEFNKFPTKVWDHILVVVDRSNNKIKWYYNSYQGVKSGVKSLNSIDWADTSFAFAIGGVVANDIQSNSGEAFVGCIDDLSIYTGTPSDTEINNLNIYGTPDSTSKNSDTDLAAYYSFDDENYVGKQDDGFYPQPLQSRIGNVTTVDGPKDHGKAAYFDGSSSLVAMSWFDVIDSLCFTGGDADSYTNKMTVALTFKTEAGGRILHAGAAGGTGFTINDNVDGDGKLVTSTCDSWHVNDNVINDGKWHQVVWSFNRPENIGIVYLDGVKIYEVDIQGTSLVTTDTAMRLGCSAWDWGDPEGGSEFFKGAVDDLYIYNKALTQDEVNIMWKNSGIPVVDTKTDDEPKPSDQKDVNTNNNNNNVNSTGGVLSSNDTNNLESIPETGMELPFAYIIVMALSLIVFIGVSRKLKG